MGQERVNCTDVLVVYNPSGETHRSVIQITIRPGKNQSVQSRVLLSRVLESVQRLQDHGIRDQS